MSPDEVLELLRTRAVELLEVAAEDVQRDRSFVDDLQVDSLSLIEFTMDLEDELGIELPDEELADATTIGALADLVAAKTSAS